MKHISKTIITLGSIAGAVITLIAVGTITVNFWDDLVLSEAEAQNTYMSQIDYRVEKINSNIGQMEGLKAQHRIDIARNGDPGAILAGEVIRLECRIAAQTKTKDCLLAGGKECAALEPDCGSN